MHDDVNNDNSPAVSIIIPTYNRKDYLCIAVESVIKQTYTDLEIIIVDNCSNDGTEEAIKKIKDDRIKYIRHPINIQVIANWIYGMCLAKGEYFAILGDDDVYRESFIESRVKTFEKFPNITAAFSDHDECDEDGNIFISKRPKPYAEPTELSGSSLLQTLFYKKGIWQIGSGLYKVNPVRQWWIDSIHSGKAFDTGVGVKIACNSSAAILPTNSFIYRYHKNQDSKISSAKQILIGYFFAFYEPLIFETRSDIKTELKDGAGWALREILKRSNSNELKQLRRQIFNLHLALDATNPELHRIFWINRWKFKFIDTKNAIKSIAKKLLS